MTRAISRGVLLVGLMLGLGMMAAASPARADQKGRVTICHKYGTPAQKTLTVAPEGAIGHVSSHGDFLGACPQSDQYVDVDGIATPDSGVPTGIEVRVGDLLTPWPTGFGSEGLDWFDNDGSCTWTAGDDLHLEDPAGACVTAVRDALHNLGADCPVLDLDGSLADGQQVDVDLETGTTFTGCPGVDPLLKFFDRNLSGAYDDGEDIVLDANNDGIFN